MVLFRTQGRPSPGVRPVYHGQRRSSERGGFLGTNIKFCFIRVRGKMKAPRECHWFPGLHRACWAAIVSRVSPSWEKMELIRAISSADLPSAMQQAMAEIIIGSSQGVIGFSRTPLGRRQQGRFNLSYALRLLERIISDPSGHLLHLF